MTRRTLQVEHTGHRPNANQIAAALRSALTADGLTRDGDYKIVGSAITSGGPSTITVDVDTKPAGSGQNTDDAGEDGAQETGSD